MNKIILVAALGIVAVASVASVFVAANGSASVCGFVAGCNQTNTTITKTVTGANETVVAADTGSAI